VTRVVEFMMFACSAFIPPVFWRCWLGGRKGIWPVKNRVLGCWCGYLSGARCRLAYGAANATATHLSLASVKSRLVLPFWYRLTRVVPEKGPLNRCVCVCARALARLLCIVMPVTSFVIEDLEWHGEKFFVSQVMGWVLTPTYPVLNMPLHRMTVFVKHDQVDCSNVSCHYRIHYCYLQWVAKWLAWWTQVLKGPGSNRSRDIVW